MRSSALTLTLLVASSVAAAPPERPVVIAHRGMLRNAPENTLAAFGACIDLGLGFELDVRRTKDGVLVVLHDETVDRTTDGASKVAVLTLDEIKKLDAGRRFDPCFAGQRVPTFEEVFALLRERKSNALVAMDLKISDPTYEVDIVALANKHRVLPQLVFIGRGQNAALYHHRVANSGGAARIGASRRSWPTRPVARVSIAGSARANTGVINLGRVQATSHGNRILSSNRRATSVS